MSTTCVCGHDRVRHYLESSECLERINHQQYYCPCDKYRAPTKPISGTTDDAKARKEHPMVSGLLDYFPDALAAVAHVSFIGNKQHNPGQPMHWARGKSTDHADCIVRHLKDRGMIDTDGEPHSAKVAWRALALLQEELEAAGAPLARGAKLPEEKK